MAISDWLESNIDDRIKHTGNGKEVHFNCVFCSDTRHRMYVNLNSSRVYCHNCGYSGNIIGLIQYVEGISYSRAFKVFKDVKGNLALPETISRDTINNVFMGDLRQNLDKRAIPLPEEYSLIDINTKNIAVKRAIKYLHSRGITDKQIVQHKMGFCISGEYKNRVIIPITEDNQLRFWVARSIDKNSKMKEKSPSDSDWNISKSEVIFNIDKAAKKFHSVILSEGIFDALAWGDIGTSLLGKSLYTEQLNILLDYRGLLTNGIYIALDWDAKSNAIKMAEQLSEYFKVYLINIPESLGDPNEALQKKNRKFLYKLMENAEEFHEFSGLKNRLLSLY